jgi:glycosyltransferase involved in cell wall biosynthesis
MYRLVHIITSFDIGGAEQFLFDLCSHLDRKRFHVRVVAIVRGGPMRAEFHEAGIPTDVVGKATKFGFGTIRDLVADLQSPLPDIVHTHLFGGDTWGRIAALRAGVPRLIRTEQNTNRDEGIVKRFVKSRLDRRTDRIVAVSDAVRTCSVRRDWSPQERMVIIPNGVDLVRFRPEQRRADGTVRLLCVARLVRQKGIDVLIDALARIRDRSPDWSLDIVGDGVMRNNLNRMVRSYHLEDRVHLRGFQRNLASWYHRSDVVVVPSRWEGFGVVAAEAGACGLPVIASGVGGLHDVLRDQETGILVPPDDVVALSDALLDIMSDRARRILFGHAARRHVAAQFDIVRVAKRYEEVYQQLMVQAPTPRPHPQRKMLGL